MVLLAPGLLTSMVVHGLVMIKPQKVLGPLMHLISLVEPGWTLQADKVGLGLPILPLLITSSH